MIKWLVDIYNSLVDYLWALVLTLFDLLKDFFLWIFDQVLELVLMIMNGMGYLFDGLNVSQYFSAIPSETQYMLNAYGLSQCLGMIVTALTIRVLIQMIPFVRWGS